MEKTLESTSLISALLAMLSMVIFGSGFFIPPLLNLFNKEIALLYISISAVGYLLMFFFGAVTMLSALYKSYLYPNYQ